MELVIDDKFKETYEMYFGGVSLPSVLEIINTIFNQYEPDIVTDTVNIIKTSMVCGFTYTECHKKILNKILQRFPAGRNIDRFILSIVVRIMVAAGSEDVHGLIKSPRNIYREIAAKRFRIPQKQVTEVMIGKILAASKKFEKKSYTITEPATETWDEYFYNMSVQVARNSKCLSRRIGCVMVKDKSILSTGYNGPPRGIPRCDMRWKLDDDFVKKHGDKVKRKKTDVSGKCPRRCLGFKSGKGLDICPAGHAERNALINAARNGVKTMNTTLYMSCEISCSRCLVEIINAGVKEIVCTSLKTSDDTSMYLINNSNLGVRLFDFIK